VGDRRKSDQPPLRLTVATNGKRSSAADSSDQPPDRLALHRSATGTTTMNLGLREIDVSAPAACQQLLASDSLATPPVALRTSLDLSNGKATGTVSLLSVWRCVRGRQGNITKLKTIAPRPLPQRPGLAASITGPRTVKPDATRGEGQAARCGRLDEDRPDGETPQRGHGTAIACVGPTDRDSQPEPASFGRRFPFPCAGVLRHEAVSTRDAPCHRPATGPRVPSTTAVPDYPARCRLSSGRASSAAAPKARSGITSTGV
jgi:hypothetical protein